MEIVLGVNTWDNKNRMGKVCSSKKFFSCTVKARNFGKFPIKISYFTGGIDGKFRHFEQDGEYKLQLNLNHGLNFPISSANGNANGNLYGRLHSHQSRGIY